MKNVLCIILFYSGLIQLSFAQLPDTDIFLSDIKWKNDKIEFTTPVNITNRTGYDNQPTFSNDGKSIYYSSLIDSLQTDIFRYDLREKKHYRITSTIESEFSPQEEPKRKTLTAVRIDNDSVQRLHRISISDKVTSKAISGTEQIGYYCRLNDSLLAMFKVDSVMTLHLLNLANTQSQFVTSNIGRCFKLIPGQNKMLFVLKEDSLNWWICLLNLKSLAISKVAATLSGSEDFEVMSDGTILSGKDGILFSLRIDVEKRWSPIADFRQSVKDFYRLTLSRDEKHLAIVGFTGNKP